MARTRLLLALLALVALMTTLAAACGDDEGDEAEQAATSTTATACLRDDLDTIEPGVLTVGTDKPAFPPYFVDDDPSNGQGFESAVAYGIADRLGFAQDEVNWVVVPFNSSYAPGPKRFDFDINQISITPQREQQVDFSEPYYTTPQAVLVPAGSPLANATSAADLKDAKFGVQVGTTSLDALESVIDPSQQPQVFNDSNDTVRALKSKQVEAIVVDLPTAIYLRDVEVPGSKVVGQFPAPGGDDWGVVLAKDSTLTPCVNEALGAMRASGELDQITAQWIGAEAPVLDLE
jgi:polar amino acid transport system substrate-binding protein